jgi:pimeloyl-ACP methyl ester carboxylesterase
MRPAPHPRLWVGYGPGPMRRLPAPLAASLAVVLAAGAIGARQASAGTVSAGLGLASCAGATLRCGGLTVPLDHSGRTAGSLRLAVAAQPPRRSRPGVLVGLSGGPGQSSVSAAGSFAAALTPLLGRHRLVVLDQRGTGAGALRCPALQRLGSLDPVTPRDVEACARRVGPRRAFYATQDSVADLEALRRALRVPKLMLYGVSYGTYVALQYARTHPDRVEALVLDSPIGPDGVEPLGLDTFGALPRVLREQCRAGACRGITGDPVADAGTLARRLARGDLSGRRFDARGRPRRARVRSAEELANLLVAGDLNPYLQAALPGAVRSAVDGDPAALLRLRVVADGPPTSNAELSVALNVATGCADARLPYALDSPVAGRAALVQQSLAGVPEASFTPFGRATVLSASYVDFCRRYPVTKVAAPVTRAPPDVPVLVLSGRLDLRTPTTNARAVARLFPRAQVVEVPGAGHDEADSDTTGCVARAMRSFAAGRRTAKQCRRGTNQIDPFPRAPRSLTALPPAAGVPGPRGRALAAVLATALDARAAALQVLFAGFPGDPRGGGLRGGHFRAVLRDGGLDARLYRYGYVPGLRVSGAIRFTQGSVSGRVAVTGPGRAGDGRVTLRRDGSLSGVLGGRAVRAHAPTATTARASGTLPGVVARHRRGRVDPRP